MGRGKGTTGPNSNSAGLRSRKDQELINYLRASSSEHLLGDAISLEQTRFLGVFADESDMVKKDGLSNIVDNGVWVDEIRDDSEEGRSRLVKAEIESFDSNKLANTSWDKLRLSAWDQDNLTKESYAANDSEARAEFDKLSEEERIKYLLESTEIYKGDRAFLDARMLELELRERIIASTSEDREAFVQIFESFGFSKDDFDIRIETAVVGDPKDEIELLEVLGEEVIYSELPKKEDILLYDSSDALEIDPMKWTEFSSAVEDYLNSTDADDNAGKRAWLDKNLNR